MSAALKWLLFPVFVVWIVFVFSGFLLYILVDEGPKPAWRECRNLARALTDDVKSFFGK